MTPSDAAMWAQWSGWIMTALLVGFFFLLLTVVVLVGLLCQAISWCRGKSNCLIEAIKQEFGKPRCLLIRFGLELKGVPHIMTIPVDAIATHPDLRSFVPLKRGPRRLPKLTDFLYEGAVKRCDLPACTRNLPQCPQCEWGAKTSNN